MTSEEILLNYHIAVVTNDLPAMKKATEQCPELKFKTVDLSQVNMHTVRDKPQEYRRMTVFATQ